MKLNRLFLLTSLLLVSCDNPNVSNEESNPNNEIVLSDYSVIEGSDLVNESNPLVKWEGRYEYKVGNKERPSINYLYHTATGFTIDFYGTGLDVTFNTYENKNLYFDYAIDDETLPNPKNRVFMLPNGTSVHKITLAKDLKEGHHTIKCLKMLEGTDGYVGVSKFETDGYFYYRKNLEKDRLKFMFVNASSGSGYGTLAYTDDPHKIWRTTYNSSSLHGNLYLAARRFDAEVQFVAASGWGVRYPENRQISEVIDYCGITPTNDVVGAQTTGKWNHTKYVPDIIIFHIGGNDTPDKNFELKPYQDKVVEMVEKLHSYYPDAKMIYTHTRTNSGQFAMIALEEYRYVKEVITYKVGKGPTGEGTYGASDHPSLKTQIDNGKVITDFISTTYGYEPIVDDITFNQFEFLIKTEQQKERK